ncbi:ribosome silencing factor [Lactococcus termiticola]|uniref:Ribosomal silencing factor RsfS n=1 Tax=Lactococcus termiticola TaxID=2169526 RepID=A0A2R5HJ89_9LACT|nr:ribosome silencing factor [Lactococcus termiticola]GBG96588.1 ribosome silencing factor RsfS [Lactococcus termiticola]
MNPKELLEVVVRAADAKQARDIVALDVATVSGVADYFVVMEAMNSRQIDAIIGAVDDAAAEHGLLVGGKIEGNAQSGWVLIDLGDVIVNVFDADSRLRFNLEKLWSDAEVVDLTDWVDE